MQIHNITPNTLQETHHYVYKITCHHPRHVGEEYIGMRSCDCPIGKDSYMGSGVILKDMQAVLGMQHFDKEVLSIHPTREEAAAEEARLVTPDYIELPHVLNLVTGGEDGGIPGEETRRKMSESLTGENNPMRGKQHTAEARQKMSDNNAMKRPEVRAKISGENSPMWGKHHTAEACQKMSKAQTGKPKPGVSEVMTGGTNVYYLESRKTDRIPVDEFHRLKAEGKVIHVRSNQYRNMKSMGLT